MCDFVEYVYVDVCYSFRKWLELTDKELKLKLMFVAQVVYITLNVFSSLCLVGLFFILNIIANSLYE